MRSLIMIPWHIGDRGDVTVNAIRRIRSLRYFLAEEPDQTRRQFEETLSRSCSGKTFVELPERRSPGLLAEVLRVLEREDVGLVASGGVPCFVDPGAWLVRELRRRGVRIAAAAGASCLSSALSLSGLDSTGSPEIASVLSFARQYSRGRTTFAEALRARGEDHPVVVLLRAGDLRECLREMLPVAEDRPVSVFLDLTKSRQRFPYADEVLTRTCRGWLEGPPAVDWAKVGELTVILHPASRRPRRRP